MEGDGYRARFSKASAGLQIFGRILAWSFEQRELQRWRAFRNWERVSAMKAEFLAIARRRGKFNDRVVCPALLASEWAHGRLISRPARGFK
jgi:hypothetical protein